MLAIFIVGFRVGEYLSENKFLPFQEAAKMEEMALNTVMWNLCANMLSFRELKSYRLR